MGSGFQEDVVSNVGAVGVMQLLPETWNWVDVVLLGKATPRTADGNVQAGVRYLRWQLDHQSPAVVGRRVHGELPAVAERIHSGGATDAHAGHAITIRKMMSFRRKPRVAQSIDCRDHLDRAAAGQWLRKHPCHCHAVTAGFVMFHHAPFGRE